jgi:uncharacterized protein YkwD
MKRIASSLFLISLAFIPVSAIAQIADTSPLTRGEAAKILLQLRAPKLPDIANMGQFPDVKKGDPHEKYLLYAEKLGILTEDEKGFLHPESLVSRALLLKMITLTFGLTTHTPYAYSDVPAYSWCAPYAGVAFRFSLFPKNATAMLRPESTVTREEARRMVQTIIDAKGMPQNQPDLSISTAQSDYNVTIYQKISTEQEQIPSIKPAVATPVFPSLSERPTVTAVKDRVIALANAERIKRNLPLLHPDAFLNQSAQKYAEELLSKNFFSHVSPNGQTLKDRMEKSGYYNPSYQEECFCIQRFVVGENLARGQKTADEVVADWMKSPSHRDALLNPQFSDIGVGVAAGIWVQHFGGVWHKGEE